MKRYLWLLFLLPCSAFAVDWSLYSGVLLLVNEKTDHTYTFCTAVAVAPDVALTAAHCLEDNVDAWIYYGDTYPSKNEIEVVESHVHPNYDPDKSYYENDLGWLRLKHAAPVTVYSVARPSELATLKGNKLDRITYSDDRDDDENEKRSRYWTNPQVTDVQPGYLAVADKNARPGDSGSPIFTNRNGKPVIAAIHSTLDKPTHTVYGATVRTGSWLPFLGN